MSYHDIKNKLLYWIPKSLAILLGVFFIVFGEFDDSPGLQGLGLILIIAIVVMVIRNRNKNIIMIFKNLFKNKAIIIAIISFALGALIYNYSKVIFQEGNPWPEIKAISQLTFGGTDMVKLSDSDNKYLTKSQDGPKAINVFMKGRGYEYTDQMGSGYFYKSSDKTVVLTRRQYSRFYTIWTIGDVLSTSTSKSLADELKKCLPKSDTASHERCNELFKQITDYDSCVDAGFSIMKSNPPQCTTPDGRTFIENEK